MYYRWNNGSRRFPLPKLALPAILVLALSVACSGGAGQNASSNSNGKHLGSIVVAVGVDASFGSLVAAVKQGYFQRNGVDATIKVFPGGPEAVQAVSTGQADVTTTGQYSGPLAAAKGAKTKIVAQVETADNQFGVLASSQIKSPQDLDGKTVAMQDGSTSPYYYSLYAQHYGLKNVNVKYIGTPQLVPALANGQTDAYFSWQPYLTRGAEAVNGAHILNYSGQDNIMPERVYMSTSEKVYKNPALATAVLQSTIQASQWCTDNKAQLGTILADTYKAPVDQMQTNANVFTYDVVFDKPAQDELNRVAEYVSQSQHIPAPKLGDYVDLSFLRAIDPTKVATP